MRVRKQLLWQTYLTTARGHQYQSHARPFLHSETVFPLAPVLAKVVLIVKIIRDGFSMINQKLSTILTNCLVAIYLQRKPRISSPQLPKVWFDGEDLQNGREQSVQGHSLALHCRLSSTFRLAGTSRLTETTSNKSTSRPCLTLFQPRFRMAKYFPTRETFYPWSCYNSIRKPSCPPRTSWNTPAQPVLVFPNPSSQTIVPP